MLQLISKLGLKAQPDPRPIPNGYGTVRFPHFRGHPGFVMVVVVVALVSAAVVLVAGVWAIAGECESTSSIKERGASWRKTAAKLIGCMIVDE